MLTEMPIMPLNAVLFPGMPMPMFIFEQRYRDMIQCCLEGVSRFGVALIREGREVGGPAVPWKIGTTASIVRALELEDGGLHVLTVGVERFCLHSIVQNEPYLIGRVRYLDELDETRTPGELHEELRKLFEEHLHLLLMLLGQPDTEPELPESPARLSNMVAAHLTCPPLTRQRLLEMNNLAQRLFHERQLLQAETDDCRLLLAARRVHDQVVGHVEEDAFSLN